MSILNFIFRLNRIGFENLRRTFLPSLGGEGGGGAEFSFVLDDMRIPPSRIFSSTSLLLSCLSGQEKVEARRVR